MIKLRLLFSLRLLLEYFGQHDSRDDNHFRDFKMSQSIMHIIETMISCKFEKRRNTLHSASSTILPSCDEQLIRLFVHWYRTSEKLLWIFRVNHSATAIEQRHSLSDCFLSSASSSGRIRSFSGKDSRLFSTGSLNFHSNSD